MNPTTHLTAADALSRLLAKHGEPVRFKVYPEGKTGRLWFWVWIYPTPRALNLARLGVVSKIGPAPKEGTYAFLVNVPSGEPDNIGNLCFSHWSMTDATVSHECTHAAVWYLKNKRVRRLEDCLTWTGPYHERTAECIGMITSEIWRNYTRHFPRKECWGFGRKGQ